MARDNPDEYAWQLFLALGREALPGKRGHPHPTKSISDYTPDAPVVWETWARSSGGRAGQFFATPNRSEVFLDQGARPPPWSALPHVHHKHLEPSAVSRAGGAALVPPSLEGNLEGQGFESLMNEVTYETIRDHALYNIEGLEAAFLRSLAGQPIQFPAGAQAVKAMWARILPEDKPRYHWRSHVQPDGQVEIWGLTGLHIITRDLDNWFWSDFEHQDYLARPVHRVGVGLGLESAELASRDTTTRGPYAPAVAIENGVPLEGVRMETYGTKWRYYRLRGTQISYTDAAGQYTLLANTQIEKGFQQTSSCMTCHARATIGIRAPEPVGGSSRLPNTLVDMLAFEPILVGPVGKPDPRWYLDAQGNPIYVRTSFLWSMPYRAQSQYH